MATRPSATPRRCASATPRHAEALAAHAVDQLLEAARQGVVDERELPLFGPPREILVIRAQPLVDGADLLGAVALIHDVTDTRRVESVRRDFVANVSHELKTPLGALGLLAETMASADDVEVVRRLAEQLVRESDRLGRIVDDLLDLSLIEAQEAPSPGADAGAHPRRGGGRAPRPARRRRRASPSSPSPSPMISS